MEQIKLSIYYRFNSQMEMEVGQYDCKILNDRCSCCTRSCKGGSAYMCIKWQWVASKKWGLTRVNTVFSTHADLSASVWLPPSSPCIPSTPLRDPLLDEGSRDLKNNKDTVTYVYRYTHLTLHSGECYPKYTGHKEDVIQFRHVVTVLASVSQ